MNKVRFTKEDFRQKNIDIITTSDKSAHVLKDTKVEVFKNLTYAYSYHVQDNRELQQMIELIDDLGYQLLYEGAFWAKEPLELAIATYDCCARGLS